MCAQVSPNPFQQAVYNTPSLGQNAYRPGLRALGGNSSKVQVRNCKLLGSVYLEETFYLEGAIQSARWDYGIGIQNGDDARAVWVEVHPADTSRVKEVIQKLKWLKEWLATNAPALHKLTPPDAYYWIASDGVHITPNSHQARSLAEAGLKMPRRVLVL